jgi:hypothetical protein
MSHVGPKRRFAVRSDMSEVGGRRNARRQVRPRLVHPIPDRLFGYANVYATLIIMSPDAVKIITGMPDASATMKTLAANVVGKNEGDMTSRPEEFHLRALPEPCMTLSSHTAPDVRPLP